MTATSCIITILAMEWGSVFRENNFRFLSTGSFGDCSKNSLVSSLYCTHIMNDEIIIIIKKVKTKNTKNLRRMTANQRLVIHWNWSFSDDSKETQIFTRIVLRFTRARKVAVTTQKALNQMYYSLINYPSKRIGYLNLMF